MPTQKRLFTTLGVTFWVLAAIFVLLPSWPHIYYRLSPQASSLLASTIGSTALQASETIKSPSPSQTQLPSEIRNLTSEISLPEVDPSLPAENGLIIEKIGVRGEIHEGDDWQTILKQGIWRVPSFATPITSPALSREGVGEGFTQPVILAAHRWGYLDWSASFRKLNSFYNLPQLKVGDKLTIVWDQRPFEYEVYATDTGTEILDYDANLILYTCQLWNSPVRFFVYAQRTN